MGVNLIAVDDGSLGLSGADQDTGAFIFAPHHYGAASVDVVYFTATRALKVVGVVVRVTTAGTDAGAVTLTIRKVPSGTAITSGTALHSGTANLKGTINTNQTLTLSTTPSDLFLAPGDSIAADFTGVLTAATGAITVAMVPR